MKIYCLPYTLDVSTLQHGKVWCDISPYDTNSTAAPEALHKLRSI